MTDRARCPRCGDPIQTVRTKLTREVADRAARRCSSVLHTAEYRWDARSDR